MKLILSFILLALAVRSQAQFNKGQKVLGGSLSFYSRNTKAAYNSSSPNTGTSFGISPSLGIFVKPNLAVGALVTYSSLHIKDGTSSGSDQTTMGGGMFLQRYFTISDKFFFTIMGSADYSSEKETFTVTDPTTNATIWNTSKTHAIGVHVRPSFIFFPSPKWALEATLGGFNYNHALIPSEQTTDTFNFYYGSIGLGVYYYIGR